MEMNPKIDLDHNEPFDEKLGTLFIHLEYATLNVKKEDSLGRDWGIKPKVFIKDS